MRSRTPGLKRRPQGGESASNAAKSTLSKPSYSFKVSSGRPLKGGDGPCGAWRGGSHVPQAPAMRFRIGTRSAHPRPPCYGCVPMPSQAVVVGLTRAAPLTHAGIPRRRNKIHFNHFYHSCTGGPGARREGHPPSILSEYTKYIYISDIYLYRTDRIFSYFIFRNIMPVRV